MSPEVTDRLSFNGPLEHVRHYLDKAEPSRSVRQMPSRSWETFVSWHQRNSRLISDEYDTSVIAE